MFHSAEVRWFFRGELSDEICGWFEMGGLGKREPERVDDYLVLPGCATTSVKFRGGRIEVKALTNAPQPVRYPNEINGLRDAWVKWSSNVGDRGLMRDVLIRDGDRWLAVEKRRYLRLISLVAREPTEVEPGGDWLPRGCQVELTAIRVWSRGEEETLPVPWWSLSFEAFNDPVTVLEDLDRAAEYFFRSPPPVPLERDASMSYPAWLSMAPAS